VYTNTYRQNLPDLSSAIRRTYCAHLTLSRASRSLQSTHCASLPSLALSSRWIWRTRAAEAKADSQTRSPIFY